MSSAPRNDGTPWRTVSVVLATCNGARFIEQQINSILAQTLQPLELIIGDDQSTDDTEKLVRDLTSKCGIEVTFVRNETVLGFRENFLRHALRARGDLIAFCDQDDIWSPEKLARCERRFDLERKVTLVSHAAELIDEFARPIGKFPQGIRKTTTKPPLSYDPWGTFWGFSMVFRREVVHLVDVSKRFIDYIAPNELIAHDRWIMFLCQMLGSTVEVDEQLVQYRQHGGNLFGHRARAWFDIKQRSHDYIAATRQMIAIIEKLPDTTSAMFPLFKRERCIAYLRRALEQLEQRHQIYASATTWEAVGKIVQCLSDGRYRGIHDGRFRWKSVARDLQVTFKR